MRLFLLTALLVVAACGSTGGGSTCERPFGAYTLTPTLPTDCPSGQTPSGAPQRLTFGSTLADGGTGVSVDGADCAQNWSGCDGVVTCAQKSFSVSYDQATGTLSGSADGVCQCEGVAAGGLRACDVSGTKG